MLSLIDHLPRTSAFVEAVANDETLVRPGEEPQPRDQRWSEWSPEREMLAHILDRLGALIAVVVQVNGGKPARLDPYPRPKSAAQRVADLKLRRLHDSLSARLYLNRR